MKVLAIALNTSREAIRNKVLYSIVLFAALLTAVSGAFGSVTIGDKMKFVKDFSLLSISLFGAVTTVVLGVSLLSKELGKRTIYNILSKPVARWQFLVGKFVGLYATLVIMMVLMASALFAFLWVLEGRPDWRLLPVVGAMLLELGVLLSAAILFSSVVVTPALAGLFTAATFVVGRSAGWLKFFFSPDTPPPLRYMMRVVYALVPHLDQLYVADRVVSGQTLSASYYLHAGVHATAYAALLLILSVFIFERREFV